MPLRLSNAYNLNPGYSNNTSVINKSGGTLSGPLILAANPTTDLEAAPKQYIDNVANVVFSQANSSYNTANSAYAQANTGYSLANSIYDQANTIYSLANTSYNTANSAYDQANSGYGLANSAYNKANVGYGVANTSYNTANLAYDQANAAYGVANSSVHYVNSKTGNNVIITSLDTLPAVIAKGNVSGSVSIDLSLGQSFTATITAATTFTFANTAPGSVLNGFVIELTNAGTNVTWPTVKWPGGSVPPLKAAGVDVLVFISQDNGTTWRGAIAMSDSK